MKIAFIKIKIIIQFMVNITFPNIFDTVVILNI